MCATPLFAIVRAHGTGLRNSEQKGPSITSPATDTHTQRASDTRARVPPVALHCAGIAVPLSLSIGDTANRQHVLPIGRALTARQLQSKTRSQFPFTSLGHSAIVVASLAKCLRALLFWRAAPQRQRRDPPPPSQFVHMMQTQLRVAVIGAQRMVEAKNKPYTVRHVCSALRCCMCNRKESNGMVESDTNH